MVKVIDCNWGNGYEDGDLMSQLRFQLSVAQTLTPSDRNSLKYGGAITAEEQFYSSVVLFNILHGRKKKRLKLLTVEV